MSKYGNCCICEEILAAPAIQCPNCGQPHYGVVEQTSGHIASRENIASSLDGDRHSEASLADKATMKTSGRMFKNSKRKISVAKQNKSSNTSVVDVVMPEPSRNDFYRAALSGCLTLDLTEETATHIAKLKREAATLQGARKSIRRAIEADEARKQMIVMEIADENRQEVRLAILKQHEMELIQAADRWKLLEEEAAAMIKRQEMDVLECTRRRMQFDAARRRREQDLADLEWRRRTAEQAAMQAALRRSRTNFLGQNSACGCSTNASCCPAKASQVQWNQGVSLCNPIYQSARNELSSPLQESPTCPGCCCTTITPESLAMIAPASVAMIAPANLAMIAPEYAAESPTYLQSHSVESSQNVLPSFGNVQGGPKKFSASGKIRSADIRTNWMGPMTFQGSRGGSIAFGSNKSIGNRQQNSNHIPETLTRESTNDFDATPGRRRSTKRRSSIHFVDPNKKKSKCTIQ